MILRAETGVSVPQQQSLSGAAFVAMMPPPISGKAIILPPVGGLTCLCLPPEQQSEHSSRRNQKQIRTGDPGDGAECKVVGANAIVVAFCSLRNDRANILSVNAAGFWINWLAGCKRGERPIPAPPSARATGCPFKNTTLLSPKWRGTHALPARSLQEGRFRSSARNPTHLPTTRGGSL